MTKQLTDRTITQVLATSTGGVGTHVCSVARFLSPQGVDVRVIGPQSTQDLFDFTSAGARFAAVEIASGPKLAQDARAIAGMRAATADADLIHAHGLRAATVAAAANLGRDIPLVVTLHNAVETSSAALRRMYAVLERFVARSADVVIGASQDLADRARECGARYVLMRRVAAPPMAPPTRDAAAVRSELGISGDTPMLLSIGRLHPQKGYHTLLEAARSWQEHPAAPVAVIAGDGPLREELQQIIDAGQLRIQLLGHRKDVADLLGAADVVLLPSVWEASPLAAQEAMRAGVPLVATTSGGTGDLVADAAYRIEVGDVTALANAVRELVDNPQRRSELSAAGRARAAELPNETDTAEALVDIYSELLGRGPAG